MKLSELITRAVKEDDGDSARMAVEHLSLNSKYSYQQIFEVFTVAVEKFNLLPDEEYTPAKHDLLMQLADKSARTATAHLSLPLGRGIKR